VSKFVSYGIAAAAVAAPLCGSAGATTVRTDFNDLTPGQLPNQGGGTGFAPASTWAGGTGPAVVTGDLTAPASTNFALTQSGTPQRLQAPNGVMSGQGQDYRAPAATLTGDVWFSFLVNPASANSRGGIGFSTGATSTDPRVLSVGSTLYVGYGSATTTPVGPIQIANKFTVGQTSLVLGNIRINDNGTNDRLRVWVNPNVAGFDPSAPPTPDVNTATLDQFGNGLGNVSVSSYTNATDTASGIVDLVSVSDGANAFFDVTGVNPVPEPGSLGLLGLAAASLLTRRRRA
jgi:hypothetical protein